MVIEVTFDTTDVYISTTVSPVYVNVSFEAPSGGGGAVWGDITGTLSNQTDLQTALDGKFDDPTGTALQYIDGTGSFQTFPLTLPVLQEVRNQTGATLDAGTVVYINGATGNKPTVTKAIATGDATSAQTLGMVSAAIANNGTGYVVVIGTCSGLDTSAYTEGQQLYLSGTTAGAVTTTKPYAPIHLVYVGIVTRAHPTLGTVEVRVQNGYELDEIHDVDALNPNNNDGIFYNSTTSLWEHKQISTALGYTPANAATTLTINGVTYDLSTSRTFSVGSVTGTGASGQVSYWDGTTSQAGSADLTWDNTNKAFTVSNTNASSFSDLAIAANGGVNVRGLHLYAFGSTYAGSGAFSPSYVALSTGSSVSRLAFVSFGSTAWYNGTSAASGEAMQLTSTGNLLIGTTTNGGQRLQVQGTTLLNGNVTFSSATGMFWDATNSRLGIGTNAPAFDLNIVKSTTATIGIRSTTSTEYVAINFYNSANSIVGGFGYGNSGTAALYSNKFYFAGVAGVPIAFILNGTEYLRMFPSNGNLLLQNGGTYSDSGQRLQVQGTTLLNGNVTFSSATGMFWDATNSRLGIGTNAPAYALDVVNNSRFRGTENYFGGTNNNGIFSTATYSSANYPAIESNSIGFISGITSVVNTVFTVANKITFQIGTGSNSKKAEFATSTGNFLLQNGGTFTDSGERLQVTGTMKVTGASSFGGDMTFTLNQNLVTKLEIVNTTSGVFSQALLRFTSSGSGSSQIGKYSQTTTPYKVIASGDYYLYNGTSYGDLTLLNDFATGNIKFAAGGSSTAHMTIKSNGRINMSSLPTSSTGLSTGDLWNDAGTIKIV